MRGKLMFLGGLAAGFVLGARAGREKYDELVMRGRKVLDNPTIQEAAGAAQAQANRIYAEGKERISQTKLGEKMNMGEGAGKTPSAGFAAQGGTTGRPAGGRPSGTAF